jgi:hypothetical protein
MLETSAVLETSAGLGIAAQYVSMRRQSPRCQAACVASGAMRARSAASAGEIFPAFVSPSP